MIALFDPAADTAPLAVLHATSFPDAWDAQALRDMLAGPGVFAYAADDGFVMARSVGGEAEILTLAVRPEKRDEGLGRALLQAAITKAQQMGADTMFLEVGVENLAALALYISMGFAKVGDRKGYYAIGSGDALVLRLPLPVKFP